MPLDFPSSPTNGQVYGNYYYNSARGAWNALLPAATPNFFTSAQLIDATVSSSASSTTPLVVIGSSGQSVDLQQWKDSAGTILADISANGALETQYVGIRNTVGSAVAGGESQLRVISPDNTKDIRFWNRNDAGGMYYYNSAGGSANVLRITHSTTPRLVTQLIQDFTSGNSADFGARVNVSTVAAANIGLVVRASASQTADLQQWQSSTGAVLSDINADGELQVPRIGVGSVMPTTVRLQSTASTATEVPIVARGAASQSANLQEWKNSSDAILSRVSSSGSLHLASALEVASGGTGATTVAAAQDSLGIGLIPITSGSATSNGGSVTQTAMGVFTITGVTSVSFSNVFSSTFQKYRIIIHNMRFNSATAADITMQLRAGTTNTAAGYHLAGPQQNGGTLSNDNGVNLAYFYAGIHGSTTGYASCTIELYSPAQAIQTNYSAVMAGWTGAMRMKSLAGFLDNATAYDGFTLAATNSQLLSATLQVFAYNE